MRFNNLVIFEAPHGRCYRIAENKRMRSARWTNNPMTCLPLSPKIGLRNKRFALLLSLVQPNSFVCFDIPLNSLRAFINRSGDNGAGDFSFMLIDKVLKCLSSGL